MRLVRPLQVTNEHAPFFTSRATQIHLAPYTLPIASEGGMGGMRWNTGRGCATDRRKQHVVFDIPHELVGLDKLLPFSGDEQELRRGIAAALCTDRAHCRAVTRKCKTNRVVFARGTHIAAAHAGRQHRGDLDLLGALSPRVAGARAAATDRDLTRWRDDHIAVV